MTATIPATTNSSIPAANPAKAAALITVGQPEFDVDIALAYAQVFKALPKPPQDNRWSVWGTGFGGSSHANGDPTIGSNDVTANTYGFASGADYHFIADRAFATAGGPGTGSPGMRVPHNTHEKEPSS